MDQVGYNSDEMYEGFEPDFEDMDDGLKRDFDEMYDDFDAMNDAMNNGGEAVMVDLPDIRNCDNTTKNKDKLILGCERSGQYRPWKNFKPTRSTWSRKCECPFRLRGTPSNVGDGWYLHVVCGMHNHKLAKKLIGHAFLGRLSHEEKIVLGDMTKNMIKPRNILMTIKDHNVTSLTTIKQVYNARQAYRSSLREHITSGEVEVIVTDRDLALMNAVEYVFSKAVNLLCLFHVCKNVKAKCKMTVFSKKKQVQIMEAWEALVYSYDEAQYYMNLARWICCNEYVVN
ncbi:uncharacterized protein [Cicer arietinum]|uniref:uncharacterized protein n=1 Tax=Cicer arietinum TaxID=3827 RepID=UPI003CC5A53E